MSTSVAIRDLKAHLSRYLARVQAGEVLEVTSHRRVVARVIGVVPQAATMGLANLVMPGVAQWQGGKPLGTAIDITAGGTSVSDWVTQDRG